MVKERDDDNEDWSDKEDDGTGDDFGLPKIDPKPLSSEPTYYADEEKEQVDDQGFVQDPVLEKPESQSGSSYRWVGVLVIIGILLAGLFLMYRYVYKPRVDKKRAEQVMKRREAERLAALEKARLEQQKQEAAKQDSVGSSPEEESVQQEGTITVVSSPTSKYYVIIASCIDEALLYDYAEKLKQQNMQLTVIKPYGNSRYTRLAVSYYEQLDQAQQALSSARLKFDPNTWVLRY